MSTDAPHNMLFADVEYQTEVTRLGTWRRFLYPHGALFEEFVSHGNLLGLPLVHYTRGVCPETGKRVVAKGVVAIGRLAIGIVAIGQASAGVIAIGQLAVGLLFGLGQASTGIVAVGQLAIAVMAGLGQATCGNVVIGQFAFGHYVLAQIGFGVHVMDARGTDPQAADLFGPLFQ
jgi:hypothetical protein